MAGGGKGTADPSASSGGASAGPSASIPTSTTAPPRACESCEAAPGIPFCRVEWSFLCASCGPTLHRNSWIVAVPPFPTSNSPNPITPPTTSTTTSSSNTNQPPPYYFPPFMQMPMPPQAPFQMPMQMHLPPSNTPNLNTSNAPGTKRRRRRRSKEEILGAAPTDTDTDRAKEVRYGQKRKTRLRPSAPPPAPPTRTDSGNADMELQPGVKDTMISNVPESTGDEAQVDAVEKFVTEMDPPPTELDEIEEAIGAEGEP